MARTLLLLATDQALTSLAIYLPGVDGGNIRDVPNDNFYFAQEIFSRDSGRVYASIPQVLRHMMGVKILTVGYTKDADLVEDIAKAIGAQEVIIRVCPEANLLWLDKDERLNWSKHGWQFEGAVAFKSLARTHEVSIATSAREVERKL